MERFNLIFTLGTVHESVEKFAEKLQENGARTAYDKKPNQVALVFNKQKSPSDVVVVSDTCNSVYIMDTISAVHNKNQNFNVVFYIFTDSYTDRSNPEFENFERVRLSVEVGMIRRMCNSLDVSFVVNYV